MKNIFILLSVIGSLTFLFGCSQGANDHFYMARPVKDSLALDLPRQSSGILDTFFNRLIKEDVAKIGLPILSQGTDSPYIRLWLDWGPLRKQQVVSVFKTVNGWSIENCRLYFDDSGRVKKDCKVQALRNDSELIEMVLEARLHTLPQMHEIPGYGFGVDGSDDFIEISTNGSYKLINYWEPELYEKKNGEIARYMNFRRRLIEKIQSDLY